jgi:hypothetical protein
MSNVNTSNNDEFGRDLTLKIDKNLEAANNFISDMVAKFKKKSWIEICWEIEEEEEREAERLEKEKLEKVLEERRYLHSIGEYDLEEGELLE